MPPNICWPIPATADASRLTLSYRVSRFGNQTETGQALIDAVHGALVPGGTYIQFQHFLADLWKVKKRFPHLRLSPVLLNLPPAFVYYARK